MCYQILYRYLWHTFINRQNAQNALKYTSTLHIPVSDKHALIDCNINFISVSVEYILNNPITH